MNSEMLHKIEYSKYEFGYYLCWNLKNRTSGTENKYGTFHLITCRACSVRYRLYKFNYYNYFCNCVAYLGHFIEILDSQDDQYVNEYDGAMFKCTFKSNDMVHVVWEKEHNNSFPEKTRFQTSKVWSYSIKENAITVMLLYYDDSILQ